MTENKDDTNRWKDIPCSSISNINIAKMTILPKAIYRFNAIPVKISLAFFTELEQTFFNLYGNTKDPEQPKQSLIRKMELEQSGSLTSVYATKPVIKTKIPAQREICGTG